MMYTGAAGVKLALLGVCKDRIYQFDEKLCAPSGMGKRMGPFVEYWHQVT